MPSLFRQAATGAKTNFICARVTNRRCTRISGVGFKYKIIHASPESGLDSFKHQLETETCDAEPMEEGKAGVNIKSAARASDKDSLVPRIQGAEICSQNHNDVDAGLIRSPVDGKCRRFLMADGHHRFVTRNERLLTKTRA
jgi:hypothetical protein